MAASRFGESCRRFGHRSTQTTQIGFPQSDLATKERKIHKELGTPLRVPSAACSISEGRALRVPHFRSVSIFVGLAELVPPTIWLRLWLRRGGGFFFALPDGDLLRRGRFPGLDRSVVGNGGDLLAVRGAGRGGGFEAGSVLRSTLACSRLLTIIALMVTAVLKKEGTWWAAYVEEIPGVNTQGATIEEARENLKEALQMVLEANREIARQRESSDVIREELPLPV